MKRALVLQHVPFEDLGTLESALLARNYSIRLFDATTSDLCDPQMKSAELLIILGGPISVNDVNLFPFLKKELEILNFRKANALPTLGICLGAQLMSLALGGTVTPQTAPEIGWKPLSLTTEGEKSLLSLLGPTQTSMLHWHGETFSLPEGAIRLAFTDSCHNQAFSWGDNWLALQFHPEVIASKLERWYVGHINELNCLKIDIQRIRTDSALHGENLINQAMLLWASWLAQVERK